MPASDLAGRPGRVAGFHGIKILGAIVPASRRVFILPGGPENPARPGKEPVVATAVVSGGLNHWTSAAVFTAKF
jgi:hypothetical protein